MFRRWPLFAVVACTMVAGCTEVPPTPPAPPAMNTAAAPAGGAAGGEMEMMPLIPSFTPAEQAQIKAQKTCPVGGEDLGSMGMPIKVKSGERVVFLCCKGCIEAFEKEPEKFLAKLDAAAVSPADAAPETTTEGGTPAAPATADPPAAAPTAPANP